MTMRIKPISSLSAFYLRIFRLYPYLSATCLKLTQWRRCMNECRCIGGNSRRRSWFAFFSVGSALAPLLLCDNRGQDSDPGKLFRAIIRGNSEELELALKSGKINVNKRHQYGWTALHVAVVSGNVSMVEYLIEKGADVNVKDEFSRADRIAAVNRTSVTKVLHLRDVEFSNKFNHWANFSGFTPLHYAVVMENYKMVDVLLRHGADPTIENTSGHVPLSYAMDREDLARELRTKASEMEARKLQHRLEERRRFPIEDCLHEHIIGQDGAITTVASAIRRKELGWMDGQHPLVFLFLGSSGIGKTELAKQVARYIHRQKKDAFIRLDMSEYQEKHEVAKLIGSPPGYIGHEQGGQLTSRLRKCPNAVVLFDEVDKAHPDVLTVLLQLFDEGRLTDGKGKTIECKNAIFVMTSNLANDEISQHAVQLRSEAAAVKDKLMKQEKGNGYEVEISRHFKEQVVEKILKRHFKRDEFLGRINEFVYFLPFSKSELIQLVARELKFWQSKAAQNHKIYLEWSPEVEDLLTDGYNIRYGARSIKHEVERAVVNQLAIAFERQVIKQGEHVRLVVDYPKDGKPAVKIAIMNCS